MLNWLRTRGLCAKLVLTILLILAPASVMVIFVLNSLSASFLLSATQKDLTASSRSAANSVEQWDRYFVMALENVRGQPDILNMDPADQLPVLLQMKKTYDRLAIVRVTRPDGISTVRTDGTTPVSYADRAWFRACIGGVPIYRQVLITRTTGTAALNISMPIYSSSGKVVGVLSALAELKSIPELLGLSSTGRDFVFLVDAQGHAMVHPDVKTAGTLCDLSQYPSVKSALSGHTGDLTFTDSSGSRWLSHSDRLSNGWFVISQISERDALAPRAGILRMASALLTARLILAILLSWWIGRILLQPIRQLTEAARAMADGNLDQTFVAGGGEIAALAASFIKMRDAIREKIRGLDCEITERQLTQDRLAALNQTLEQHVEERTGELHKTNALLHKFSYAVEQTSTTLMITDLKGTLQWVNSAATVLTGYSAEELRGKNPRIFRSGLEPQESYRQMWAALSGGNTWRGELQNRRKNGELYWIWAIMSPIRNEQGEVTSYLAVEEDITERKRMEEELRSAARTDRLTGLPNRALLCDRLEQTIQRSIRSGHGYALFFIDFDRFKSINDSLGHDAGDALLIQIANRLRGSVRPMDSVSREAQGTTAARLGGDEFVILLDNIRDQADAIAIADRVLNNLAEPYLLAGREVFSTASMGIVTSDAAAQSADAILRDADTAMYEAKLAGRGRYVLFDATMRTRVLERLELEHDLHRAIEARQLFLEYQPIISLDTGEVGSFEALVRWRHPQRGLISPAEFIPMAEDSGLIVAIGQWVLRQACRDYAMWRSRMGEKAPPSISVNLSRIQLMIPDLPAVVRTIITATGIEPGRLHLEITESAVMRDPKHAIAMLHELKQIGVKLDLDDFGTGYSSLASLHTFPLDVLKIDRSFIANVCRGRHFAALVQAINQLAQNLGMSVVAEGIETQEQLQALQSLDCQFAQGFLFSRPMDIERAMEFRTSQCMLSADLVADPA